MNFRAQRSRWEAKQTPFELAVICFIAAILIAVLAPATQTGRHQMASLPEPAFTFVPLTFAALGGWFALLAVFNPGYRLRWPSFSLRTLLLLVTFFCCLLGPLARDWQIVRDRCAAYRHFQQEAASQDWRKPVKFFIVQASEPAPFPRNWLGDINARAVVVPDTFTDAEIAEQGRIFPEATVQRDSQWNQ